MKQLVGKIFTLAEGRYRIVDVQKLRSDTLVFAERAAAETETAGDAVPRTRTAFHIGDIAPLIRDVPGV